MDYIGNVLINNNIKNIDMFFKRCQSLEEVDPSLPVIIVGLERARKLIKGFNILKKSNEDKSLWWTFSKTEKRNSYEEDMLNFKKHCLKKIIEGIDYIYINPLTLTYSQCKKWINYLMLHRYTDNLVLYIDNDRFIHIYDTGRKKVYGISLTTLRYIGIESTKIEDRLKGLEKVRIINNFIDIPREIRNLYNDEILNNIIIENFLKNGKTDC
jgi:hypothetical protein